MFGPSLKSMAFSLNKEFPVKENIRLQFRTEVFNLFNTPEFNTPSAAIQYGSCSVLTTRCSGLNGNFNSGFITALNTNGSSRQIQFALKVLF